MKLSCLLLLALCAWRGPLMAGSIDWGTAAFDALYNADGGPLDGTFRFELGTFAGDFTPSPSNTTAWASQWKGIEEATFNAPSQYAAENSILTTSGPNLIWQRDAEGDESGPLSNPNVFAPGEAVYLWVYNSKNISSTAQWALVTGRGATPNTDWVLNAGMGAALAPTVEWRLLYANTAIQGGVNGVLGGGVVRASPGSFSLQTALLSPIPEPSISLLLALGWTLGFRRSRR